MAENDIENLKNEMLKLNEEIEAEKIEGQSAEDRVLQKISRRLLQEQFQMTTPGSTVADSTRIERLTKLIADQEF